MYPVLWAYTAGNMLALNIFLWTRSWMSPFTPCWNNPWWVCRCWPFLSSGWVKKAAVGCLCWSSEAIRAFGLQPQRHRFLLVSFIIYMVIYGSVGRDSQWALQLKPFSRYAPKLLSLKLRNGPFIYDKWGFLYSCQVSFTAQFPIYLIFLFVQCDSSGLLLIYDRHGVS